MWRAALVWIQDVDKQKEREESERLVGKLSIERNLELANLA
jgi:hypothetical protein